MGRANNTTTAIALSKAIKSNTTLIHLDISYNTFSVGECEEIASGLKDNHTIYGVHAFGNACTIESRGFMNPAETSGHLGDSHHFRRLTHSNVIVNHKDENLNC